MSIAYATLLPPSMDGGSRDSRVRRWLRPRASTAAACLGRAFCRA